jgi:hypothetical protein
MNYRKPKNFFAKITNSCFVGEGDAPSDTGGASDGGAGGGGGSPDFGPSGGGTVDTDAGHSFESRQTPSAPEDAAAIMAQGDDFKLDMSQMKTLLGLDFAPKPAKKAETVPVAAPAAPVAAPAAQPTSTAAAQPAPAITPDAIAQAITQGFEKIQQPAAQSTTPAEQPKPKTFYGELTPAVAVSEALSADLLSGDPVKATGALNTMVNGIMNKVMEDSSRMFMQALTSMQQQMQQSIPSVVTAQHATQTNQAKFFQGYGELDTPAFRPVVDMVAKAYREHMTKQGKQVTFSAEDMKAIGEATHKQLQKDLGFAVPRKGAAPIQVQQPQNTQVKPAPSKQPWMTPNGGSRPPAGPGGNLNGQSADVLSHLI